MLPVIRRVLRASLLAADGLVLLLFGLGYAARYVSPTLTWWPQLIAIALPYLSLALVVLTVVVAFARRWGLLAVHVVALVLALARFASFGGGAAPAEDDLTLLTLNTSRGGHNARAEDLGRAITALVREVGPDLVAFQEAYIEYHPDGQEVRPELLLAALIDSLGYHTVGPRPAPGATYTPQPVLGRVELIEQTQTILQTAPEAPTARVVRTHFRWQGREAVHYNLHLRSFGPEKPWDEGRRASFSPRTWLRFLPQYREAFRQRAVEIRQIRTMIEAETLPLIVSGDFNSTPHNWGFHGLAAGLQDAFKTAGEGWGATYHRDLPLARIDHVLVSPEWEVVEAHTAEAPFSDHLPLVVRLRWAD